MICEEVILTFPIRIKMCDRTHLCASTGLAPVLTRVPDLYDNGVLKKRHCDKYGAGEQPQINEGERVRDR